MKSRLISELKKHILICAIGLIYYIWVVCTNLYIPCPFRLITGLKCPGCGISHMLVAICQLDFTTAFYANPLLLFALPIIAIIYIIKKVYYIKTGTKMKSGKIIQYLEYLFIFLLIVFCIIRNIPLN